MLRGLSLLLVGCLLLCAAHPVLAGDPAADDLAFFEKQIRPVLVTECYACHSAAAAERGKLKGGLALDTREALLRGGESGPAVVPGKPDESLLLDALRNDGLEMPPKGKLPAAVIADFTRWIERGAVDPREGAAAQSKRGLSLEEGRKFWSLIPPKAAPVDVAPASEPGIGNVDRLIRAKLTGTGLEPAPEAEPRILIRRLYFDIAGLPPPPDEVEAFVQEYPLLQPSPAVANPAVQASADARENAYEGLVDRLLASPRFGERWGRHWLDVARYADSNGRDRNVFNYHAWRYRDYVIASLNADKPYDQFIREQIAGDLLPAANDDERDTQRIATGFLALGAKAFEEAKPEVFRMDLIDEQIELVSRAFLGISVGCARCHDHKFDPVPTADYYALAGIFRSTQPLYGYGPWGIKATAHSITQLQPVGPAANELGASGLAYLAQLQQLVLVQNTARSDRYRVVRRKSDLELQLAKPDADKAGLQSELARLQDEIKAWDVTVKQAEESVVAAMDAPPPQPGWAMAVRDRPQAEDCRIHIRGETTNLSESVPRGVLQVIDLSDVPPPGDNRSGRLELARWLSHRHNPLTARVQVNRVWLHLFGRGLVTTPDDYGVNGARPSHPELLDDLAVRFMDGGWSTKQLIRELVLSRTYRQADSASAAGVVDIDPENIFLARSTPRRLEAEPLRDAILSVSGVLRVEPPRPDEAFLAKFNPYRENEFRTFSPLFKPADLEGPFRSVYLPVVRGVLPELFQLFDFAAPDRCVPQRDESIVPVQALFLMNSPWIIDQARHAAQRLLGDAALDDAGRVDLLYRRALARPPTTAESERAFAYLAEPAPASPAVRDERWADLCQMVLASAEFRYVR